MNQGRSVSLKDGSFFKGECEDYPVLMPLSGPGEKTTSQIAFCREISPIASVLVPDVRRYIRAAPTESPNKEEFILDRISAFLVDSIAELDIGLCPIIAVGHGAGADLGVRFTLRRSINLAAAILYKPTAPVPIVFVQNLTGFQVLLVTTERANLVGSSEWKIRNAFSSSGAQVICEYVPSGSRRSKRDAALARVFLASLFGLSD